MSGEHGRGGIMRVQGRQNRFIKQRSVEARAVRAEAAAAVVLAGRTGGASPSAIKPTSERLQRKLEDAKRSLAAERERARSAIKDKDNARLLSAKQVESLEAALEVAQREIAALKKANIKLQQQMELLLSVAGTVRPAEGRGKSNSESQRKAILKKRKAIKGCVAVRPLTKLITVPSVTGGARRGWYKREVKGKLMGFLEARYNGGCGGNTVLQLLSGFFDENPDVFERICDQRGVGVQVERKVVAFIREHWSKDLCSFLKWLCQLPWRKYGTMRHAISGVWNSETSEYEPLTLPYGTDMATLWSPSSVVRADKEVADAAGMVVSEDGLMAQVDVRAALTQRLQLIPLEQLEAQLTIVGDLVAVSL
mmetsp:Transcript_42169/g.75691  ORF Transcript_42169/g.75691 Transcript_42169/m.75691 type:complete len:366 (-) Transcript_42169:6-1103(-)|eukprot:CAMPEP_0177772882 /NCGR_PEP_ID=MMETSP0491_2-20121128/12521_1 /TAXON_ID=63592 /ORGANISM="Tetraselmis chuii, Strain PLY429" /LENGTH=365 /DNA_ID=CAMNT_0019290845 /DNA_START=1073 /DNA_END=2170 /DNA_ORIENTATION=-